MTDFSELFDILPFSLDRKEKCRLLTKRLCELTEFHKMHCVEYENIVSLLEEKGKFIESYYDIPFLPVRLFKNMELRSISPEAVFKTMTSSGTTSQEVSKIFLDRQTAANQQKVLVKIVSDFTGKSRMPMLILDCPSAIKSRSMFSARGAGILGFSILASERRFALDDNMNLDMDGIKEFLKKHTGKKILLFGFTFMIWQYFYKELLKHTHNINLENAILIHGGGWKRLERESVDDKTFKECLTKVCGLHDIHNYYGMVEQTGCIYMQCECGNLHASIFSDVIVRRMNDFSVCEIGEKGIIQVVSLLPESYPGHSILTEDTGVILGEDDCSCGRKGKYIKILGRIKDAEVRGCSDTYEGK